MHCAHWDITGKLGKRSECHSFLAEASRQHFITWQGCRLLVFYCNYHIILTAFFRNVCRKVHNFTNHHHVEDAISVNRIVEELNMETPSPVLLYKPQGINDSNFPYLAKDTFLLVLMTEFQASLFETYSSKIVCVDSSHKTNQYQFNWLQLLSPMNITMVV